MRERPGDRVSVAQGVGERRSVASCAAGEQIVPMATNKLFVEAHLAAGSTARRERPRWWRLRGLARSLASTRVGDAPAAGSLDVALGPDRSCGVLVRATPFRVTCLDGCVWVTHPANPGDHILRAGGELEAAGPGHLVVVSMEPSRIRLSGRAWTGT